MKYVSANGDKADCWLKGSPNAWWEDKSGNVISGSGGGGGVAPNGVGGFECMTQFGGVEMMNADTPEASAGDMSNEQDLRRDGWKACMYACKDTDFCEGSCPCKSWTFREDQMRCYGKRGELPGSDGGWAFFTFREGAVSGNKIA